MSGDIDQLEAIFHKLVPKSWSNWVKDFQRGGAPAIQETTGERVVVFNCLADAYDKDPARILTELHFIFDVAAEMHGGRPQRIRKILREEIYAKVARIECTEKLDKVIEAYHYVYTFNTKKQVNIK